MMRAFDFLREIENQPDPFLEQAAAELADEAEE